MSEETPTKAPEFWEEGDDTTRQVLRVAGGSNAAKVAGAIFKFLGEGKSIALIGIGAGAVNQMVKAIIFARAMVAQSGGDLYFVPGFVLENVRGERKTAIKMYVRIDR